MICNGIVTTFAELHIRHGTTLLLRKVKCGVSKYSFQHVLIWPPLLEALGLDTRAVLEAA